MSVLLFELPYPPSVNHYWRMFKGRMVISRAGREYRSAVMEAALLACVAGSRLPGRLSVSLAVHPPDNRRRDLDNILKAILDGLQAARVYEDDSQVDRLSLVRSHVVDGGRIVVTLEEAAHALPALQGA